MKKSIILVLAGLAAGCGADEPGVLPRPEEPARVTVSDASMTASVRTFPATVVAASEARLATRMSGTILEIPVDVGSRVRAGDTLVVLDAEDIRARVAAAEAGVELASKSFQRIQNLARDGAASQAELDRARAALLGAEATLGDARAQSRYAILTAPFAGTVTVRSADPGDLAAPGVPIVTVTGAGGLEVEADLPSTVQGSVEVGQTLSVFLSGDDAPAQVRVTRVVPALEAGSRRFRVEARFLEGSEPEGLVPGAYARMGVPGEGESVRWIPTDALVQRGQLRGVYVVEGEELRLRWVRLGETRGEAVELLAGPTGPLRIVRNPDPTLFDGRPVGETIVETWEVSS